MSRYRKIEARTWSDERFRALSPMPPSGQGLWFFLLTGPHTGPVPGLFRAGRAGMAEELGWRIEDFDEAFGEVLREGLAKANFGARLVWLPKAVKHNKPESPNVVRGWRVELDLLPECDLKWEAIEGIRGMLAEAGSSYVEAFNSVAPKPSAKPSPKPSAEPSPKRKAKPHPKTEPYQEQEQDINTSVPKGTASAVADALADSPPDPKTGAQVVADETPPHPPPEVAEAAASAPPPMTAKERLWALGVALLGDKGRAWLGKAVATYGEATVLDALSACNAEQPGGDAKGWLTRALEARAKAAAPPPRVSSPRAVTADDLLNRDPRPPWVLQAGFDSIWQAENEGCYAHNAALFRRGQRIANEAH